MADPVTVIQVISASTSLVAQCAKVIKGLHNLAGKYRNAEISIRSTAHELDIIRLAWERIESVLRSWEGNEGSDDELLQRLRQNLEFGALIVASLAEDMGTFTKRPFTFTQRSKYVWSEKKFNDHQDRIRGQVSAMNLLVSVLKMPSAVERLSLLHEGAEVLRKSDESAYSIVPSHMSSRLPSIYSNSSRTSMESAELVYRQLTVDDDLFTARVYKRNYRHPSMKFLLKTHPPTSLQIRKRPSTETVATETLDHQVQRASSESQSIISHDREESNSQPLHSTRATLLKTVYGVHIPGSSWVSSLSDSTTRENTIFGPAVSIDLVYVYLNRKPEQSRNLAESVSQCQPDHLVHLLRLLGWEFNHWKRVYLAEACNQKKVDLAQVLLDDDQTLRHKIMPPFRRWYPDDGAQSYAHSKYLNVFASELLLTELGKITLTKAVVRVQLNKVSSERQRQRANALLPYGLPAEHNLLLAAAYKQDWNSVDVLLKDGVDVNAKFEDGNTCLLKMALTLLSSDQPTSSGSHVIPVLKVMKLLLNLGGDMKATTHDGDNFFHLIAQHAAGWKRDDFYQLLVHNTPLFPESKLDSLGLDKTSLLPALSAVNSQGKTPALVAYDVGNEYFFDFQYFLYRLKIPNLVSDKPEMIGELEEVKDEMIQE